MADRTGIEWTDATWNPVRGCSRVSAGCRNCYAEAVAARFGGPGLPYHGFADRARTGSKWTGRVEVIRSKIEQPFLWATPRRIFVNSMSDLFHENLPMEEIASIFAVMIAAHRLRGHKFQVLTKRSARMRTILSRNDFWQQVNAEATCNIMNNADRCRSSDILATPLYRRNDENEPANPPPGIWLGVSCENAATAETRIADLCLTPAVIRFISCEPLLGPIPLSIPPHFNRPPARIDWVICGGESGPNARPMHPIWARGLRDQCIASGTPFFFKQWGEWAPFEMNHVGTSLPKFRYIGDTLPPVAMHRIGKVRAGATLDGREWREFPE